MFEGREPFHEHRVRFRIASDVVNGKRPRRPQLDRGCVMEPTDAMWALIQRCWHQEESLRPTMRDVCKELQDLTLNGPTVRLGSARPCTPLIVQSILSKHKDVQNIKKSALASLTSLCNSELERAARVKALGQVLEDGAASELFHQYISDLRDDQALKMMDVLQTVSRLLAFVARQID
jgi:hypothetical protein